MTPLLLYSITTNPFPLQASAESGKLNVAQLTIVATNSSGSDVTLQGMMVQIPIGDGATQLTSDVSAIGPVAPQEWTMKTPQYPSGYVQYFFVPPPGNPKLPNNQSLTFVFNGIEVNSSTGSVEVDVTEGSNNCTPDDDCPVQKLFLTKFPSGWGSVSFWAVQPLIQSGGSTVLHWNGPSGATYSIEYYTPQTGIVKIPAEGQQPLSNEGIYPAQGAPPLTLEQTTTFTMEVDDSTDGNEYHAQIQTVVTTIASPPTIIKFSGTVQKTVTGLMLVLHWATDGKQCTITGNANFLSPSYGRYEIVPSVDNPLLPQYTLTALNDAGQTTSTINIVWGVSGNTLDAPYGINCVVASADSTQIYAACQDGYVRAFDAGTLAQTGSLPIGFQFGYLAASPDGNSLYVLDPGADTVFAVETSGGQMAAMGTAKVDGYATANLTLDSVVDQIFVACNVGTIVAFKTTGNSAQPMVQSGSISFPLCNWVNSIGVSEDGSLLFVAADVNNANQGFVTMVDAAKVSIVGQPVEVNTVPMLVSVTTNGIFVACQNSDQTATIISYTLVNGALVQSSEYQIPGFNFGMGVSADGGYLYVFAADKSGNLSMTTFCDVLFHAVGTPTILDQAEIYVAPIPVPASSDGTKIFVNTSSGRTLWVLVPVSISGGQ
ncbi:MAG TPA: hypothetical protein VLX91_10175 [Candidatus Acidoferrales bacterium]|nr:hypothetical protein [Candidatus Acidoferrales bacterium]